VREYDFFWRGGSESTLSAALLANSEHAKVFSIRA